MHTLKTIVLCFIMIGASRSVYGQADTVIVDTFCNWAQLYVYQQPELGPQDAFYLWDYVGTWNLAEQNSLKSKLKQAYEENARVNPLFDVLDDELQKENIVYFWCAQDPSIYDSLILKFNNGVAGEAIFYLAENKYWQQLASEPEGSKVKVKINKTGFYALFKTKNQSVNFQEYISSYPNPFNPNYDLCHICYFLEANADVEVRIFSKAGDEVFYKMFKAGENGGLSSSQGLYLNQVVWDGRNKRGRIVDNGGYLCRIDVKGHYIRTWKIGVWR